MARRKRTSTHVLERARHILAGLREINPKPDFGPGLTEAMFAAEVSGYTDDLAAYNSLLAEGDDKSNRLDDRRQRLHDFNQRIQAAVKALYGPDSSEFELVGGLRRSDRKKPVRKLKLSGN